MSPPDACHIMPGAIAGIVPDGVYDKYAGKSPGCNGALFSTVTKCYSAGRFQGFLL